MLFTNSYFYVNQPEKLPRLLRALETPGPIAVDTESDSLHHYFQKVCLIQISMGAENYIVDPLAQLDLQPLFRILAARTLILHGADYDLRMLRSSFGVQASHVFDTMIAAQLLGYEQIGLAALVERHFGVNLCKQGQKFDWSKRPLPEDLLSYAASDTVYLQPLAEILEGELERTGRKAWHDEMCMAAVRAASEEKACPPDPEREWRIKGWQQIERRRDQAILRALWQWRDKEARRADLPHFKIISNENLLAIVCWTAQNGEIQKMPRLPRNITGRRLREMKKAVDDAKRLPESLWPQPLPPSPRRIPLKADNRSAQLREVRDEIASSLQIEPSLLAPAAAINAIALAGPSTEAEIRESGKLHRWQASVLAEPFLKVLGNGMSSSSSSQHDHDSHSHAHTEGKPEHL